MGSTTTKTTKYEAIRQVFAASEPGGMSIKRLVRKCAEAGIQTNERACRAALSAADPVTGLPFALPCRPTRKRNLPVLH